MKKKVLLTGASGEVGFEAFRELLRRKRDYSIRLFLLDEKREHQRFSKYENEIEIVWGDIRNFDDVKRAIEDVDVVIHLAAIIPPLADEAPELAWDVNVNGSENLIIAAKSQARPPKLIYASSVSVYGDRLDSPEIRLSDRLNPSVGDEYARTKIKTETMIQASGLEYSIFRLCGILTKTLKIQPLMFHMPLNTTLEWCYASDVGFAFVEAIDREEVFGRIFNLGGGENCTVKADEFLKRMFPLFGLKADTIPFYAFATRNFHSGFYVDGHELDDLLHFRRKALVDYYDYIEERVSDTQRFFTHLVPVGIVKNFLARRSEPLRALRERNLALIERFYGSLENGLQLYEKLRT